MGNSMIAPAHLNLVCQAAKRKAACISRQRRFIEPREDRLDESRKEVRGETAFRLLHREIAEVKTSGLKDRFDRGALLHPLEISAKARQGSIGKHAETFKTQEAGDQRGVRQ